MTARVTAFAWSAVLSAATLAHAQQRADAFAQDYPTRSVRIVVPFAPGGATDIIGRIVADKLTQRLGHSFHVDNRPGAASIIGTAIVAKAAPDGYTVLVVGGAFIINPALQGTLPYDPIADFSAVTNVAVSPNVLVIHPSVPAKDVGELVELVRRNPGKYSFASPGTGTMPYLSGELFKLTTQLDIVHVPFNGAGLAIASTIGGHTPIAFVPLPAAVAAVRQGSLRALAVTSSARSPVLPQTPTLTESGMPGQEAATLQGVLVPAGTPKEIVDRLQQEIKASVAMPDVNERLTELGFDPVADTPTEFTAHIKSEIAKWSRVVRDAKIKPE